MPNQIDSLTQLAASLKHWIPEGYTICVAESLTGGLLGNAISRTPGASGYYLGTLCAYNIDQKVRHLGVDRDHAAECKCVSSRVAREMALGACQMFGGSIGLSCTGYIGENDRAWGPFFYWAIAVDGILREEGRVDLPEKVSEIPRHQAQQDVASYILEQMLAIRVR